MTFLKKFRPTWQKNSLVPVKGLNKAGDVNKDGYDDIIIGAYGKNSNKGAVYVIYGGPRSSMFNIDLSSLTLNPSTTGFTITGNAAYDHFGYSVSSTGDINNDGYADIIIGAYHKNSFQGTAYVIYGGDKSAMLNIDLSTQTLSPYSTGFTIKGSAGGDALGWSVSSAGDINNDGFDDIIIGSYGVAVNPFGTEYINIEMSNILQ